MNQPERMSQELLDEFSKGLDREESLKKSFADFEPLDVELNENTEEWSTKLKLEINEIVWRNCGGKTTLSRADDIACAFWKAIMETRD